jgi:hypothetical protein
VTHITFRRDFFHIIGNFLLNFAHSSVTPVQKLADNMALKWKFGNGCFPGECSPELPPAGLAAWNLCSIASQPGKDCAEFISYPSPGVRFRRYACDLNKEAFSNSKKPLGAIETPLASRPLGLSVTVL